MARIILITGGARSGKSRFAQELAESLPGKRSYVATCPPPALDDSEMQERVARHREDRLGNGWPTIEEQIDIESVLHENHNIDNLLVDCLTLWISNLLFTHQELTDEILDHLMIQ